MADDFPDCDLQHPVSGMKFMPQRGTKHLLPTYQSEQKLKKKREDWYVALCQSREAHASKLQKKSGLSYAQIRADNGIEVTIQKGKHFKTMGRAVSGKIYLYVEEALFLYDSGCLQISKGDHPLAKEEVYSLAPDRGYVMEHCICYNFLRRLGYAVRRFSDLKHQQHQTEAETHTHNAINNQQIPEPNSPCRGWWPPCDFTENISEEIIIQKSTKDGPLNCCQLPKITKHQHQRTHTNQNAIFLSFSIFHMQGFTKKNSGTPAFNIAVVRFCDPFPTPGEIEELTKLSSPVPLKICIVSDGIVNFFDVTADNSQI